MTVTTSRRRFAALALCVSVLALVACGMRRWLVVVFVVRACPSGDVAKVADVDIKQAQFDDLMVAAKTSYKQSKKKFPAVGSAEYTRCASRRSHELVQEAEIGIGAKELSINVTDADVEKALNAIKKQYFTDTKTKKYDAEEVRGGAQGPEHDRRACARPAPPEAARRQDHREADEERHRHARRDHGLLHQEQVAVQGPGEPARASHPGQDEGAGRQAVRAAEGRLTRTSRRSPRSTRPTRRSAVNGGDLKMIQKGQTVPTFDAVAFKEKAGVVSRAGQVDRTATT